ncbi:transposase [Luteococcus sp. H154]|uniref:transposase n=1 Tax=unclassified Luteococcus TaxID=2639923 RepID=UPI00313E6887
MYALTVDQQGSRSAPDRVPDALTALTAVLAGRVLLSPERTAGDEVQLLTDDPAAVVAAVACLTRQAGWWIGIGCGAVEAPLPSSTREARGPAYHAARAAVERAHTTRSGLALELADPETVTGAPYAVSDGQAARQAETALWLFQDILARRSEEGWQMVDLLEQGLGVGEAAARLGISASAASQRHQRAGHELGQRAAELCVGLLARLRGPR